MDPTQMSPQQQALIMALMQQQQTLGGQGASPAAGMYQAGGMPPAGMSGAQGAMGGGMPMQQAPGGPVNPYASMLGVQPPQGY